MTKNTYWRIQIDKFLWIYRMNEGPAQNAEEITEEEYLKEMDRINKFLESAKRDLQFHDKLKNNLLQLPEDLRSENWNALYKEVEKKNRVL